MSPRVAALGLVALVVVAFVNVLPNALTYDDHLVVEANGYVTGARPLSEAWRSPWWGTAMPAHARPAWRPLSTLALRAAVALAGPSPFALHALGVALHAVNAALVFALLRRALDRDATLAAWAGAALWALHPLRVEVVASAVGLAESLCAAFALGALLASMSSRRGALALAALFCALALGAKEHAAALPLLAASLAPKRRRARAFAALSAVVLAWWSARAAVLGDWLPRAGVTAYDNPLVGAAPLQRALGPLAVQLHALAQTAWPATLSADWSFDALPLPRAVTDPRVLAVVALTAAAVALRRRWPAGVAAGFALYLVAWLPASNTVFLAPALYAERWTYLPSVFLAMALAAWLATVRSHRAWWVVAAVGLALTLRTVAREGDWRDDASLWLSAREATPRSARARNNAGAALLDRGSLLAARDELVAATTIAPRYADAWVNLCFAELALGDREAARRARDEARRWSPGHPRLPEVARELER